jgi:hypothetical protein
MNRKIMVGEIIRKKSQKIVENLGRQNVKLIEFWSTKIWGGNVYTPKEIQKMPICYAMICNLMHF